MAGVRDIVQLKLQKRLIQEQLNAVENKLDRVGHIIYKKSLTKLTTLSAAEIAQTSSGLPVSEFRQTRLPKQVLNPVTHSCYDIEPSPITNERILRIRQQHLLNTDGKSEVRRRTKAIREAEELRERNAKKIPKVKVPPSMLPNRYQRGELPCTIEHGSSGKYLSWACPLENLDYEFYLPLFFDGLQCKDEIIGFIARQGIEDMLYASRGHPERVKSVVHLLARPLRNALAKFDVEILLPVLKALQQLISCNEGVGEVLLPYGKQFLAPISFFLDRNKNIGDSIDYGQRKSDDVGEEVSLLKKKSKSRSNTLMTVV